MPQSKFRLFVLDLEDHIKRTVLSFVKPLAQVPVENMDTGKFKKILLIRVHDPLGDTLLSSSVIPNMRKAFPEAKLDLICRKELFPVFQANPNLDEILIFEKKKLINPLYKRALKKRLKSAGYDLALVIGCTSISLFALLLAKYSGAPVKAGFSGVHFGRKEYTDVYLNCAVPYDEKARKHQSDRNLDLLRYFKIPVVSNAHFMATTAEEDSWAALFYKENGMDPKTELVVGIHPGANRYENRWPVERFASLAEWLIREKKAKIVVFAGPEEGELLKKFKAAMKSPYLEAPLLPLRKFAAAVKPLKVFLCNDTGVLHIAAAVGTATVTAFGPTNPAEWCPPGETHRYLVAESKKVEDVTEQNFREISLESRAIDNGKLILEERREDGKSSA